MADAAGVTSTHRARSDAVIAGLALVDPDTVIHLPSSTLRLVLDHFLHGSGAQGRRVFAMPREEEGVAIATGLELAGRRPVLVFQDNGVGNLLTVLLTLPLAYHVPLFGVVARRGGLGEYNCVIHRMSERTEAVLDAVGVRYIQLDSRTPVDRWAEDIHRAWQFSRTTHRPVLALVNLMDG